MKNILFLAFLLASTFIYAQSENDKKIFLDSLWKETTEGNHKYYRIIKDFNLDKEKYEVFDYFKNGKIQMHGFYRDKLMTYADGNFEYYFENGNKKIEATKINSHYINEFRDWYENGFQKTEGFFYFNPNTKISEFTYINCWDKNKNQIVKDKNGYYTNEDEFGTEKGEIKNGLPNGIWEGKNKTLGFKFIETYKNGKLIKGKSTLLDSKKTIVYKEKSTMPEPSKGMQHFANFLIDNLKKEHPDYEISGRIIIDFIVEKDGTINEAKIIQGIEENLDLKAIETLKSYKIWLAGTLRGIPVRTRFILPLKIDFRVE